MGEALMKAALWSAPGEYLESCRNFNGRRKLFKT
jgi:hypothetical protein